MTTISELGVSGYPNYQLFSGSNLKSLALQFSEYGQKKLDCSFEHEGCHQEKEVRNLYRKLV